MLKQEVARLPDQVRADKDEMRLIAWDDTLAVGSPEIDRHHREVAKPINIFFSRMTHGEGDAGAVEMVNMLIGSIQEHFAEEVRQMSRLAYPDAAGHQRDHVAIIPRFEQIQQAIEPKEPDAGNAQFAQTRRAA